MVDPYLQEKVAIAAQSVLRQGFKLADETIIYPWAGGYTVAAVNMAGEIKAANTNPQGGVYKRYGENLFPYALKKQCKGYICCIDQIQVEDSRV